MKSIYSVFFIVGTGMINLSYGAEREKTPLQIVYATADAFFEACKSGDIDYLEAHKGEFSGALLTRPKNGVTPLRTAIANHSLPIVRFLLDRTVKFGDAEIEQAEEHYVASSGEAQISSTHEILNLLRGLKRKDVSLDYWRALGERKTKKIQKLKDGVE